MESLRMQTKEILEAISGDSETDDDEETEPVAAISVHLADINYSCVVSTLKNSLKYAKIGTRLKR